MHIKDIVIRKIPQEQKKQVIYPDGKILDTIEYFIPASKGDTLGQYLKKILESIKGGFPRDPVKFEEMISYLKTIIWVNFNSDDKTQMWHYNKINNFSHDLMHIRGKQPRKDQERLENIKEEFKYTCERIIQGSNSF